MSRVGRLLRRVLGHPLNRRTPARALWRVLRWQIAGRLSRTPAAVTFVNGTRLHVRPHMTSATAVLYCGLPEFADMAFALHCLRPDDVFVDIGANVGVYTVLAAGGAGARVIAAEPDPEARGWLRRTLELNGLADRVSVHEGGVADRSGELHFTRELGASNHVVASGGVAVPVCTLDELAAGVAANLVKLDVEGYEERVIDGGSRVLGAASLLAVIVELNGQAARYGASDAQVDARLRRLGFTACRYDPFARRLERAPGALPQTGNVLYVRDLARVQAIVRDARSFTVRGTVL
jgi:FkbM family methyltransferase